MIRVFIGYDENESVAYHVLSHSILRHASQPVSITPLVKQHMGNFYARERSPIESTDFSFTRFLVPYLSGYSGWSIFMDCDMLMTTDIAELWALRDEEYAVMCVKHDYVARDDVKFLGATQTKYEKKNWSSVMMFNNASCTALTPKVVAEESGLFLHQYKWLGSDDQIGALPTTWNYLVGEMTMSSTPKLIHYTLGGPYFDSYRECEYAQLWFAERALMSHAAKG
ncbi:MAG: glycosyltransferase [Ilumatobacteraceae bacterium]